MKLNVVVPILAMIGMSAPAHSQTGASQLVADVASPASLSENGLLATPEPFQRMSQPATVQDAIFAAASLTSIDHDFLMAQAQLESALDPRAKARTSSATGLFQFIKSTWLENVYKHGERFGLGHLARHIKMTGSGYAFVEDETKLRQILDLRFDAEIASLMAAALAEDNRDFLYATTGRNPTHTELYLAHFLGARGASVFLRELAYQPDVSAARLFPRPARANRSIFYRANGTPRTLRQVMRVMDTKVSRALARTRRYFPEPRSSVRIARSSAQIVPYLITDEYVFGANNDVTLASR